MMRIVVVGNRKGRRQINWRGCLKLWLLLSFAIAVPAVCAYYLLTGTWDARVFMIGLFGASAILGVGIQLGMRSSIEELQPLD